jgi:hypothetical protein
VPANPPAKQFWSVTIYDEKNRQMLINETGRFDVSSRNPAVVKNADGSTDVYVGLAAPKGLTRFKSGSVLVSGSKSAFEKTEPDSDPDFRKEKIWRQAQFARLVYIRTILA